ncbi:MAG: hypothetical protein L0216_00025 [Planctomycetales bacterium]|nr:hypothetical protein [Planctomycetales bacterium]
MSPKPLVYSPTPFPDLPFCERHRRVLRGESCLDEDGRIVPGCRHLGCGECVRVDLGPVVRQVIAVMERWAGLDRLAPTWAFPPCPVEDFSAAYLRDRLDSVSGDLRPFLAEHRLIEGSGLKVEIAQFHGDDPPPLLVHVHGLLLVEPHVALRAADLAFGRLGAPFFAWPDGGGPVNAGWIRYWSKPYVDERAHLRDRRARWHPLTARAAFAALDALTYEPGVRRLWIFRDGLLDGGYESRALRGVYGLHPGFGLRRRFLGAWFPRAFEFLHLVPYLTDLARAREVGLRRLGRPAEARRRAEKRERVSRPTRYVGV